VAAEVGVEAEVRVRLRVRVKFVEVVVAGVVVRGWR